MKLIKKITKTATCLALIAAVAIPTTTITSFAEEPAVADSVTIDETFIPFRDQIPQYLSINSSAKSETLKKIWVKTFYEESIDANVFVKHNSGVNTENNSSVAITYNSLGSGMKQVTSKITYQAGDFEAFFGNTLEANPEFLGQLLGIKAWTNEDGTAVIGATTKGTAGELKADRSAAQNQKLLRDIVGTYMINSTTYFDYFVPSMVALTKNGLYLDGSLKNVTCSVSGYGDVRADYCMLSAVAQKYGAKDSDGNYVLSPTQIAWVESYQPEFYNAYTSNSSSLLRTLVEKNDALFDLITRSAKAANDSRASRFTCTYTNLNGTTTTHTYLWKEYFFHQVVVSGYGEGAWLNLNNNINIPGISGVNNLIEVFKGASGYCCGHGSNCYKPNDCKHNYNEYDGVAVLMRLNSTVNSFLTADPTLRKKNIYGQSDTQTESYLYRYKVKHTQWPAPSSGKTDPADTMSLDIAKTISKYGNNANYSRGYAPGYDDSKSRGRASGVVVATTWITVKVNLADVLETVGSPEKVWINLWAQKDFRTGFGWVGKSYNDGTSKTDNGHGYEAWYESFSYGPSQYIGNGISYLGINEDMNVSTYVPSAYRSQVPDYANASARVGFDVSQMSPEELQNAYIVVSCAVSQGADSHDAWSDIGPAGVTVDYTIDHCDITDHDWTVLDADNNKWEEHTDADSDGVCDACDIAIKTAPTKYHVSIKYHCNHNKKHNYTDVTGNIKKEVSGNLIKYKVKAKTGETFTYFENATGGAITSGKNIPFNSSNATGYYTSYTSDKLEYGRFWDSLGNIALVKEAHATVTLNGQVKAGTIPVGARKLIFHYTIQSSEASTVQAVVYNNRGKIIGQGGTMMGGLDANTNTITVNLRYGSDQDLEGSYIALTGSAETYSRDGNWGAKPVATATLGFTSMDVYYTK